MTTQKTDQFHEIIIQQHKHVSEMNDNDWKRNWWLMGNDLSFLFREANFCFCFCFYFWFYVLDISKHAQLFVSEFVFYMVPLIFLGLVKFMRIDFGSKLSNKYKQRILNLSSIWSLIFGTWQIFSFFWSRTWQIYESRFWAESLKLSNKSTNKEYKWKAVLECTKLSQNMSEKNITVNENRISQ